MGLGLGLEGVQRLGRLGVLVLEPVRLVADQEVALVLAPVLRVRARVRVS